MNEARWLRVGQAAAQCGVSRETMRTWIRKGAVRYYRVGPYGTIRINAEDLAEITPPEGSRNRKEKE
jgi:excisionase family DNA binding protein